jgi:hypothetical protein
LRVCSGSCPARKESICADAARRLRGRARKTMRASSIPSTRANTIATTVTDGFPIVTGPVEVVGPCCRYRHAEDQHRREDGREGCEDESHGLGKSQPHDPLVSGHPAQHTGK